MKRGLDKILMKYGTAFRELVNTVVLGSKKSVKSTLRLNGEKDWGFLCSAMDLVSDTASAIGNFLQFGLEGPTKYDNPGERYLRLYGVLNATYIQQAAILNLYRIVQVPNLKKAKKQVDSVVSG